MDARISRLALGTAQFGLRYGPANAKLSWEEAKAVIECARLHGIDTIDTATGYGDAEDRLGAIGVGDFRVISKIMHGAPPANPSRVSLSCYYAVLMHRPDIKLYSNLIDLKARGLTKKIGISIYSPSELDELVPQCDFDLVQAPFNLVDQELATSGWLKRLNDMGVEVHTRSVFGRGELLQRNSLADCLAVPFAYAEIDRVIVGVDSAKQLEEICRAL